MLWIRSHIKFAVNSGQLSSMNALQVECQKRHGAELMASPTNNSFTGRGFSGRKLTNRWNLKVLPLLLLHLFSMIKKNKLLIQHLLRYVLMRCQGGIYRFQTRCYYPFWKSGNGDLQYCFRGTDTKDLGTVSCLMMPLVLKRYF